MRVGHWTRVTLAALLACAAFALNAQPVPGTPEALIAAAKQAAGLDHAGTFRRICAAPANRYGPPQRPPGNRAVPERDTWYARPYRVFDNLYFIGTRFHSAWALTTSDGIIVIDSVFEYAVEAEMIEGLRSLGLDPSDVRYILISHAHGDHDQGAAIFQRRFGTEIVMGEADWESTLARTEYPGGVPTRDIGVGRDGLELTLGETTIRVIATPGHTPGTLSYIFPVTEGGRTLTVMYAGGTAFNFPPSVEAFAIYRDSMIRSAELARAAGATVLMSNHTEFDRAYDRARIAQLRRLPGEPHPYETDVDTVVRYFEMSRDCAEAERLMRE
ncbi:MAG TPA: MBL fold metallo-hydrolase [Gammaproteobacteria bacterium]|nr:MBL fold metallo-hydrolase [Gammaproteobacteria bacterium]